MKVIEKGRTQTGWAKHYFCTGNGNRNGGCNAKLLVEFGDLFKTYKNDDTYITFKCCECGVLTDIPSNDPPNFGYIPDRKVDILHG